MVHAAAPPHPGRPPAERPSQGPTAHQPFRFELSGLVLSDPERVEGHRGELAGLVALAVHGVLGAAVVLLPILAESVLPDPTSSVRAFFVEPVTVAPPPPPPPPPAPAARVKAQAPTPPRPLEPARFVAPVDVPEEVREEPGMDLGVEGGVPGGVEGGVPGGVVGGVVGGLPSAPAPAAPPPVRVGGQIKAPRVVERVMPEYPQLAEATRLSALIILEAVVDPRGRVQDVKVLRGHPLFDESAIAAVQKWRYEPLLLNGIPTPFVLTVTVQFAVKGHP